MFVNLTWFTFCYLALGLNILTPRYRADNPWSERPYPYSE